MDLTFDEKVRLLELDDLRRRRVLTFSERSEYRRLVVDWRGRAPMTEETSEVTEETREER